MKKLLRKIVFWMLDLEEFSELQRVGSTYKNKIRLFTSTKHSKMN